MRESPTDSAASTALPTLQALLPATRLVDVHRTTVFRLTAALGALFVAAVIGLLWLVTVLTNAQLTQRIDLIVADQAHALAAMRPGQRLAILREELVDTAGGYEAFALFDAQGRLLVGDAIPGPFPLGRVFEREVGPRGAPVHAMALRTPDGQVLVVSRDITPIVDLRTRVRAIMLVSGCATIVLALVAGFALSLGPIRRIHRLEQTARRIAAGDLDLRIPVDGHADELDRIAVIINAMVGEIERLMGQIKGATDAIAHDMRTPLTHVRARLARLAGLPLIVEDPEGEAARLLAGAQGELDAALGRFRALLRISEIGASRRRAAFALLDPGALAGDVCELYQPVAEERALSLRLECAFEGTIRGDEQLLFEALSNLVENAIKFSPPGGEVVLTIAREAAQLVLAVRDCGPGIPATERAMVLDRFRRGSAGAVAPGSGLGLSLVAAIVALHGFTLSLDDAGPGLRARIVAPLPTG